MLSNKELMVIKKKHMTFVITESFFFKIQHLYLER